MMGLTTMKDALQDVSLEVLLLGFAQEEVLTIQQFAPLTAQMEFQLEMKTAIQGFHFKLTGCVIQIAQEIFQDGLALTARGTRLKLFVLKYVETE